MWRLRRIRWVLLPLSGILALSLVIAGVLIWYQNRPRPEPTQIMLFEGVEYIREIYNDPRPYIVHIVRIDLTAPDIAFLVTPPADDLDDDLSARTTSQFLEEFDLQLAINGDFFDPWWSNGPFSYYPHTGDGVNTRGLAASQGNVYTNGYMTSRYYTTLYINQNNQASVNAPIGNIYNAISGYLTLVRNGQAINPRGSDPYLWNPHPRTAVGINQAGTEMIMVLVDGRQVNYSEGVSIPELAQIMRDNGVYNAINLDGGGSVTLAVEGDDDESIVLNSPIDQYIPGRERPIANHLGIYARRLDE